MSFVDVVYRDGSDYGKQINTDFYVFSDFSGEHSFPKDIVDFVKINYGNGLYQYFVNDGNPFDSPSMAALIHKDKTYQGKNSSLYRLGVTKKWLLLSDDENPSEINQTFSEDFTDGYYIGSYRLDPDLCKPITTIVTIPGFFVKKDNNLQKLETLDWANEENAQGFRSTYTAKNKTRTDYLPAGSEVPYLIYTNSSDLLTTSNKNKKISFYLFQDRLSYKIDGGSVVHLNNIKDVYVAVRAPGIYSVKESINVCDLRSTPPLNPSKKQLPGCFTIWDETWDSAGSPFSFLIDGYDITYAKANLSFENRFKIYKPYSWQTHTIDAEFANGTSWLTDNSTLIDSDNPWTFNSISGLTSVAIPLFTQYYNQEFSMPVLKNVADYSKKDSPKRWILIDTDYSHDNGYQRLSNGFSAKINVVNMPFLRLPYIETNMDNSFDASSPITTASDVYGYVQSKYYSYETAPNSQGVMQYGTIDAANVILSGDFKTVPGFLPRSCSLISKDIGPYRKPNPIENSNAYQHELDKSATKWTYYQRTVDKKPNRDYHMINYYKIGYFSEQINYSKYVSFWVYVTLDSKSFTWTREELDTQFNIDQTEIIDGIIRIKGFNSGTVPRVYLCDDGNFMEKVDSCHPEKGNFSYDMPIPTHFSKDFSLQYSIHGNTVIRKISEFPSHEEVKLIAKLYDNTMYATIHNSTLSTITVKWPNSKQYTLNCGQSVTETMSNWGEVLSHAGDTLTMSYTDQNNTTHTMTANQWDSLRTEYPPHVEISAGATWEGYIYSIVAVNPYHQNLRLVLYNAGGSVVLEKEIRQHRSVTISTELPSGTYKYDVFNSKNEKVYSNTKFL